MDTPSRLEKIAAGISSAIISAEYFLCYNNFDGLHTSGMHLHNRFRWLPIKESNFGDTPEIFAAILFSGFIGNRIMEYGQKTSNRFLETIGAHLPVITAAAVGTYYTLGETIMSKYFMGTPDIKDVPAVIITAVASPFIAQYARKQWENDWKHRLRSAAIISNPDREYQSSDTSASIGL